MERFITIIIPVFNAEKTLKNCLESIFFSEYKNFELILVDDCSTDNSVTIAEEYKCKIIKHKTNKGAASARNTAASYANGNILFFTDSDVLIQKDTLSIINESFNNEKVSAVFGLYTIETEPDNFISNYKNLSYHYTHKMSSEETFIFWTGCGAVKRDVFNLLGGFDDAYKSATIEDIELGYRLFKNKYTTILNKKLQVTHCKDYTFFSLIKSDVFHRAIPWTKLILNEKILKIDQDLSLNNIISSFSVWLILIGTIVLSIIGNIQILALFLIFLIGTFTMLNLNFFRFCYKIKGFLFVLKTCFMHYLFFMYSTIGLSIGVISILLNNKLKT